MNESRENLQLSHIYTETIIKVLYKNIIREEIYGKRFIACLPLVSGLIYKSWRVCIFDVKI